MKFLRAILRKLWSWRRRHTRADRFVWSPGEITVTKRVTLEEYAQRDRDRSDYMSAEPANITWVDKNPRQ